MYKIDFAGYNFEASQRAEVISRISILYPKSEFTAKEQSIYVILDKGDDWIDVKQTVQDQLLRSQYEKQNHSLREKLYSRLLG